MIGGEQHHETMQPHDEIALLKEQNRLLKEKNRLLERVVEVLLGNNGGGLKN